MDVGFAYDGDADRCLCVDEKGNVITGDHILYIYGKYMKERGIVVDVGAIRLGIDHVGFGTESVKNSRGRQICI